MASSTVNWGLGLSSATAGGVAVLAGTVIVGAPAAGLVLTLSGAAAVGYGSYKILTGFSKMIRGTQQFGESIGESACAASPRNLAGLLPSGQHVDDADEPLPLDYYRQKANHAVVDPIGGAVQGISEYFGFTWE